MRYCRIISTALLLACGLTVSGCDTFDPTEWFNTKKTLPGDRKPVFPEGVPGVPQGVPPDLVQGYRPPAEPVPEPRVVEEKPKAKPKPKARPKLQPKSQAPRSSVTVSPPQQQQQQPPPPAQSQGVFPDPPRR
jgi:hypothetical protein